MLIRRSINSLWGRIFYFYNSDTLQFTMSTSGNSKTTIIISNLNKDDFVNGGNLLENHSYLGLADQIKLMVLNLNPSSIQFPSSTVVDDSDNYFLNQIEFWSNLPFLNRIIVIFKSESAAKLIYDYLRSDNVSFMQKYPYIKLSLQENLLSRSKSFDNLIGQSDNLDVTISLSKFKQQHNTKSSSEINEPTPYQFNVLQDLHKLGIDLREYNDQEQLDQLQSPEHNTRLGRSRSLTKTLFRPDLSVKTDTPKARDSPPSPTITLDETF